MKRLRTKWTGLALLVSLQGGASTQNPSLDELYDRERHNQQMRDGGSCPLRIRLLHSPLVLRGVKCEEIEKEAKACAHGSAVAVPLRGWTYDPCLHYQLLLRAQAMGDRCLVIQRHADECRRERAGQINDNGSTPAH